MNKIKIRILQPGDEIALETFLLSRVESSMFLIGNMRVAGLSDTGHVYSGAYVAAFEGDKIVSVIAHYWNHNLVFQAPVHLEPLLRTIVTASRRPIGRLIGPHDQVHAAKEALGIDASAIQLNEVATLYRLHLEDLSIPEGLRSGQTRGRRIEPRDVELMTEWNVAYAIEAIGEKDSPPLWERYRTAVERSLHEGRTWVLEDSDESVACSSFNTAIKEAVQVGGVWTPLEHRHRGYGRSIVAASLLDARREGVEKAILFTGDYNIAAQKVYTALGFLPVGKYGLVLLQSPCPSAESK
jgi:predicted GNAT family acetyltransferase